MNMKKRNFWKRLFFRDSPDTQPYKEESTNAPPPAPPKPDRPDSGTMLLIPDDDSKDIPQDVNSEKKMQVAIYINDTVSHVEIDSFPCIIGRAPENAALLLEDKSVSRRHAVIDCIEGAYFIADTDSSNGVFVNDKKLEKNEKRQVHCNDTLRIGRIKLQITDL